MVWGWIIGGIVTIATFAFDYYNNKQTVEQIEEAVDKLTVEYIPGLTFEDFLASYWIHLLGIGITLYVSYRIAHPRTYLKGRRY